MKIGTKSKEVDVKKEKKVYKLLPLGDYPAVLTWIDKRESEKGSTYKELVFKITAGDHKDRRLWVKLFDSGVSQAALDISAKRLNSLKAASNLADDLIVADLIKKAKEVVGKEVMLKVGIEKGSNGFKDRNNVLDFLAL